MVKNRTRNNGNGVGCPSCRGTKKVNKYNNLIAKVGKQVEKLWDYELNEIKPEDFRPYSKKMAWFKCPNGHSFKQKICTVLSDKRNETIRCTVCKELFFKHQNNNRNLISKRGECVKIHWDYDLNTRKPEEFIPSSKQKVWFKCPNGHSFKQNIFKVWVNERDKKIRCQVCSELFDKNPNLN